MEFILNLSEIAETKKFDIVLQDLAGRVVDHREADVVGPFEDAWCRHRRRKNVVVLLPCIQQSSSVVRSRARESARLLPCYQHSVFALLKGTSP